MSNVCVTVIGCPSIDPQDAVRIARNPYRMEFRVEKVSRGVSMISIMDTARKRIVVFSARVLTSSRRKAAKVLAAVLHAIEHVHHQYLIGRTDCLNCSAIDMIVALLERKGVVRPPRKRHIVRLSVH